MDKAAGAGSGRLEATMILSQVLALLDKLEQDDDVQKVFHNLA